MSATRTPTLRKLIACPDCGRQFDASGLAERSTIACPCGRTVEVPRFRGHDAAAVRCSACGGSRREDAASCEFCGVVFTLGERDLRTICPSCMARISDHARFCHHCGTKIGNVLTPAVATDRRCPACGVRHKLGRRDLDEQGLSALECPTCAGLWLDAQTLDCLFEKARVHALAFEPTLGRKRPTAEAPRQSGPIYRRCPRCRKMMTRREFSRGSRVVVDSCLAHGFWFDAQELAAALRWVREGGERHAALKAREDAYDREKSRRFKERLNDAADGTHAGRAGQDFIPNANTAGAVGILPSPPIEPADDPEDSD